MKIQLTLLQLGIGSRVWVDLGPVAMSDERNTNRIILQCRHDHSLSFQSSSDDLLGHDQYFKAATIALSGLSPNTYASFPIIECLNIYVHRPLIPSPDPLLMQCALFDSTSLTRPKGPNPRVAKLPRPPLVYTVSSLSSPSHYSSPDLFFALQPLIISPRFSRHYAFVKRLTIS